MIKVMRCQKLDIKGGGLEEEEINLVGNQIPKEHSHASRQSKPYGIIVIILLIFAGIAFIIVIQIFIIVQLSTTETNHPEGFEPPRQHDNHGNTSQQRFQTHVQNQEKLVKSKTTPKTFEPISQEMKGSRIRNQITKRKIYAQKQLTRLNNLSPLEQLNITSNSDISFKQFYKAIELTNLTGRVQGDGFANKLMVEQRQYYEEHYHISSYKEIPFCVVVPTFKNMKNYKYYFNLHSIMQQQYQNFRVIIVDDASEDGTSEAIQKQIDKLKNKQRVTVKRNGVRVGHMENIYSAVHQLCRKGQILVIVDGDDQLIGFHVFKVFNAFYQQTKALTVYSNHLRAIKNAQFLMGTSQPYNPQIKSGNHYRTVHHNYSHLKTTWVDLFLEIKLDSLQEEGRWFSNAVDNAIYFCVMEMSCGQVEYLPQLTYKYNMFTGNNVFEQDRRTSRVENAALIKHKTPYRCVRQTNEQLYLTIKSYFQF